MMLRSAQRYTCLVVALAALAAAPIPASAQTPAADAASTLEARLERIAAEIERHRVEQHAAGAAVAIVRGGEVIFARGFGLANVTEKAPVTPDTRFFIGSTTKAFTATLVGMLVDEGRMHWDDPVDQHLPYFKLAIDSKDPTARATLRDLLSHRTGFPRMGMLSASGALSSEEILRQASQAEPFSPFRQRFHYNNEQYLAAGWAAAAAAGRTWDELTRARILAPLGMTDTETSVHEALGTTALAHGYTWHEDTGTFQDVDSGGVRFVEAIAPAGSLSSTALDMTKWLRFLLARGEWDGQRLIQADTLAETWIRQIAMNESLGYGMGWMLSEWRGQPLILHGGDVPGYSAMVALLPESDLGIVVLVNQIASPLGGLAVNLVPSILLGDEPTSASRDAGNVSSYLGRYVANFATFSNEIFTVQARDEGLALDIPSQMVFALNPPDAQGRWQFALTDQIAVSFRRNDAGDVVALNVHQSGMTFEALREGVVEAPEIDLAQLDRLLGTYRAEAGLQIETFIQNQRLAIRVAGTTVFDLHPPDAEGRWAARANAQIAVAFDESDTGEVTGLRFYRPGGAPVLTLAAAPRDTPALPTVEDLLALRPDGPRDRLLAGTLRIIGTIRFPQSAVTGRVQIVSAGADRVRTDIDLGRLGVIRTALNGDRGWVESFSAQFVEIDGEMVEQQRLIQASVLADDWRRHFDSVAVLRREQRDGKPVYVVALRKEGLPNVTLRVDAETGDVLDLATMLVLPGGLGRIPSTTRFEDYRVVAGVRLPFRHVESNDQMGRTIYEVEEVEFDVDVDEELFILRRAEPPVAAATVTVPQ